MKNLNLFVPEKRRKGGKRNDRIASQLKECFSISLIKDEMLISSDGRKLPMVSITYVDLSPDLQNCIVFFSAGTNDKDANDVLSLLESRSHYFKDLIAKKMKLRLIPSIKFKIDDSFEYSQKIDLLLKDN
jgi:ribosome-binding factor A